MRLLGMILFSLLLGLPAAAQTDTVTIPLTGGYSITVPAAWETRRNETRGYVLTTNKSQIVIQPFTADDLLLETGLEDPDLADVIEWVLLNVYQVSDYEADAVEISEIEGLTGYSYTFETALDDRTVAQQLFIYEIDDNNAIASHIVPQQSDTLSQDDLDALQAVLESISRRNAYVFFDGSSFGLVDPAWTIIAEQPRGLAEVTLSNGVIEMHLTYWSRFGAMAGLANPRDFLAYIWDDYFIHNGAFERRSVSDSRIAGDDAIYYPFTDNSRNERDMVNRGVFVFELSGNRSYVTVEVFTEELDSDFQAIFPVLDSFSAGDRFVCPLFVPAGISIRAAPSTSAARVRQTSGELETVIAEHYTTGDDGFRWFNIGDGWVRSDVVFFEQIACNGLPESP